MEQQKFQRPPWDDYFAKICADVARRSTCFRRQLGAIVVNDKHEIVATGYNGVVRGAQHCDVTGCIKDIEKIESGMGHGICPAVHAEQNALLQAGRHSNGCTLYLNAFPCKICARLIVNAGIKSVVTSGDYTDKDGLKILQDSGIDMRQVVVKNG